MLLRPSRASAWFAKAPQAAQLGRLTPHELRHTAPSLAVSSGANVRAVERVFGHKSASMTLDAHADLFDVDIDEGPNKCTVAADVVGPALSQPEYFVLTMDELGHAWDREGDEASLGREDDALLDERLANHAEFLRLHILRARELGG